MRILFISLILFVSTYDVSSQVVFQPKQQSSTYKGIIYNKEFTLNFSLHTNGVLNIGADIGKIQSYYKTRYYHIDIGEMKHHKEFRQSVDNINISNRTSRSFTYGKQNSFYVVRVGYGQKRYYSEKYRRKGLAVGVNWQVGPALGLLKPYYLELQRPAIDNPGNFAIISERYSEDNEDLFLDVNRIFGAASFSKGLDELQFIPGIQAKVGVHFDWGAFEEFVTAVEAGIMVDVFPKKIDIMVSDENRPYFVNLYITLQLGKRW